MFDGEQWLTLNSMPRPFYGHAAVALDDDRALICGGYVMDANGGASAASDCYIYTASNDSWTHAPPMAFACVFHDLVLVDGELSLLVVI